jgi:pilus assembly protein CpaF
MPTLIIQDQTGAMQQIALAPVPFKIGKRAGVNHLVLPELKVSREHCVIHHAKGQYVLEDLGSRNGTILNGLRVQGAVPIAHGGIFRVGPYQITFADTEAQAAQPASAAAPAAAPEAPASAASFDALSTPSDGMQRTPVALKRKMHDELIATLDLKHTDFSEKSSDEIRERATNAATVAAQKFAADRPSWLTSEELVREIVNEAVGLGCLEDFLEEDSVDEIMVNGWNRIYIERKGKIELTNKQFTDNDQVLAVIRRILAPLGRRVDESSPMVDARLADGSRVNAIIPPLALTGPTITIRKFSRTPFGADDLVKFGSMTQQMGDFLRMAVLHRQNCCISGGTGSGKTTLLNVLSSFIPEDERIVTIEDAAELQLNQDHVISLEAKPPTIEGRGAVHIRELVINALRMRPDRIIIGECRGGEALDMLQAMNTGHDGSLTTLHANSPRDALARLDTLVLMAGIELPTRAVREQIASAIHVIVHGARLADGTRKITAISEVTGMEGDIITLQSLYEFRQTGFTSDGKVKGALHATGAVPKFVHSLRERGIPVDMDMFKEK